MLTESEVQIIEHIKNMNNANTKSSLSELLKFINSPSHAVKITAIEALREYGRFPTAKRILIDLLQIKNWEIRIRALESLEKFPGKDVISAVLSVINDRRWLVRITCVEVLEIIGHKSTVPYLLPLLSDQHALVRCYTAETVAILGGQRTLSILLERLQQEKRMVARLGFFFGLVWLGEEEYLRSIIKILTTTKSYQLRCAAINSLTDLADHDNINAIKASFEKILKKEQPRAVTSTVETALIKLESLVGSKQ